MQGGLSEGAPARARATGDGAVKKRPKQPPKRAPKRAPKLSLAQRIGQAQGRIDALMKERARWMAEGRAIERAEQQAVAEQARLARERPLREHAEAVSREAISNRRAADRAIASLGIVIEEPSLDSERTKKRKALQMFDDVYDKVRHYTAEGEHAKAMARGPSRGQKAWNTRKKKVQLELEAAWKKWRDETQRPSPDAKSPRARKRTINRFRLAYQDMRNLLGKEGMAESWYFIGDRLGFGVDRAMATLNTVIGAPNFEKTTYALY